jgi:hypothetical protein
MGNKSVKIIPKPNIERIITEVLFNVRSILNKKVEVLRSHEQNLSQMLNSSIYSVDSLKQKAEMGVHHFKAVQACKKVSIHL